MAFCLPKAAADKLLAGIREGKVNPEELIGMSSIDRRAFLEPFVGQENVHEVNAQLESKLILADQKRGLVSWAKSITGLTEARRADLISRIEKLDRVLDAGSEESFLADLAEKKLGTSITFEEGKAIVEMSKEVQDARDAIKPDSPIGSDERLRYGSARVILQNYVNELKLENETTTFKGMLKDMKEEPLKAFPTVLSKLAGLTKGIKASLDNSALFRQGWKTIFTHPDIWAKNAVKSFHDIVAQAKVKPSNSDIINGVKAEIYSRPNALNRLYDRAKLDIGVDEEAYPTSLPERIPVLGRLYKASETAYTGFLYRMRADIFDQYAKMAENNGVNLKSDAEARSLGLLTNSLTGRGNLGSFEKVGKQVNTIFFSPKMLKANLDFLTAHTGILGIGADPLTAFARKRAAVNLLRVVAGTAAIMTVAQATLGKKAVELDPRSSDFGKIRVGDTRFDISGGMASIPTLAARLLTASTKSTTTGKVNPLNAKDAKGNPKFGAQTGKDVFFDFATNKASPFASVLIDMMRNSTFSGQAPTLANEGENLFVPLPITNAQEVIADPKGANAFMTIIADGLGIATNTYGKK